MSLRVDTPWRLFPDEPHVPSCPSHSPISHRKHLGQFDGGGSRHCNPPASGSVQFSCQTCGINSCNGSILWIARNVLVLPRIVDCRLFAAPAGNRFVLSRVLFVLSAVAPLGRPSPWLTAPAIVVDLAGSHHRLLIALFPPMPMKGCWREPFTSSNIASAYRWLVRSPT